MARLIDADALKLDLTRFYDNEITAKRLIDEQPTIDAIPVEWMRKYDDAFDNVLPISSALRAWEEGRLNNG